MSYWKTIKPYLKTLVDDGKGRDTIKHARHLLKQVHSVGGTKLALRRVTDLFSYEHKTFTFEKFSKKYAGDAKRFENTPLQYLDYLGIHHAKSQFKMDNTWDFSRRVIYILERDSAFSWRMYNNYTSAATNPKWLYGLVWGAIIHELRLSKEWEQGSNKSVPLSNPYGIINRFRPFFDAVAREAALELAGYVRPENWSN